MSSIVIEQEQSAVQLSFELHRNASLGLLRLSKATIASVSEPEDPSSELFSEFSFKPGTARRVQQELTLATDFEFKISRHKSQDRSGEELVAILCTFEAKYALNPEFVPTPEQIEAFHRGNAVFNCWPFFREFIQNTAMRLNYPPPPIPFLRLQPKSTEKRETTTTRGPGKNRQAITKRTSRRPK